MRLNIILICIISLICSCSSDRVVVEEKREFLEIFKKMNKVSMQKIPYSNSKPVSKKNKLWLEKFNQPIILIASLDNKNQATLVSLGNNKEQLTWVSADGISLTFNQGVLVATRGYSEDLIALKKIPISKLLSSKNLSYKRTHRYLNGENRYSDITFNCEGKKLYSQFTEILDLRLPTDRLVETCNSLNYSFTNEYELLAGTRIVVKSTQWISPTNKSFLTYNLYAFQKL